MKQVDALLRHRLLIRRLNRIDLQRLNPPYTCCQVYIWGTHKVVVRRSTPGMEVSTPGMEVAISQMKRRRRAARRRLTKPPHYTTPARKRGKSLLYHLPTVTLH